MYDCVANRNLIVSISRRDDHPRPIRPEYCRLRVQTMAWNIARNYDCIHCTFVQHNPFQKKFPLLEGFLVLLHLLGIVVVIPLWVLGPKRGGGVLIEYYNGGGWNTVGLSTMVGDLLLHHHWESLLILCVSI
jgi:hypothetical protein